MKIVCNFVRVLAVVLAAATLAAFFFPMVNVAVGDAQAHLNGLQCAIGADLSEELGTGMATFKGGYYFGALVLTVLTFAAMLAGLLSKKTGWNGTALVLGILNCILLISFIAKRPEAYVDMGRIAGAVLSYNLVLTLMVIGGIASVLVCLAGILIKDALRAKETGELTIPKRILKFLREYKSELKKVVWPNGRSVLKNTLVVLAVCGFALLLIWLIDSGLGELFRLIFGA